MRAGGPLTTADRHNPALDLFSFPSFRKKIFLRNSFDLICSKKRLLESQGIDSGRKSETINVNLRGIFPKCPE